MYIEKVYSGLFQLINLGLETFGDGVQVGDLIKLPAFYDEAKKIYVAWPDAKEEIKDITPDTVSSYVNDFVFQLLNTVKVKDAATADFSVDKTILALKVLESVVTAIKMKTSDGITWDDISVLPYIISKLWEIANYMPEVKKELGELSKREISLLASTFVYTVYNTIVDWDK